MASAISPYIVVRLQFQVRVQVGSGKGPCECMRVCTVLRVGVVCNSAAAAESFWLWLELPVVAVMTASLVS